jgi:hypothetical protein
MADIRTIPDRLCADKDDVFYDPIAFDLEISANGEKLKHVVEYCISERWYIRYKTENGKLVTVGDSFKTEVITNADFTVTFGDQSISS